MSRRAFNREKCNDCKYYWDEIDYKCCHFKGKKIYNGDCVEYIPVDSPISNIEKQFESYEQYQVEWN